MRSKASNDTILTSHRLDETRKPFDVKHKELGATIRKGKSDEQFREFFRELQNKLRSL